MKLRIEREAKTALFREMPSCAVFCFHDEYFMKVTGFLDVEGITVNAFSLQSSDPVEMDPDDIVEPCPFATLTI